LLCFQTFEKDLFDNCDYLKFAVILPENFSEIKVEPGSLIQGILFAADLPKILYLVS